jgi:hypothetical protein
MKTHPLSLSYSFTCIPCFFFLLPPQKYLKSKTGPAVITWNFATYYVVSPNGNVEAYSGVEPLELKDTLMGLLQNDEL